MNDPNDHESKPGRADRAPDPLPSGPLPLDQLPVNQVATIVSIEGDDSLAVRLMEMGLLDGEPIEFIGAAPLGDPLEFRIQGYHLSLRRSEAKRVIVSLS